MAKEALQLIEKLATERSLTRQEYAQLLKAADETDRLHAQHLANLERQRQFQNRIFVRGLVEFTNFCKNNCLYCGIRNGNHSVERYRLTNAQILSCLEEGYAAGFRTLVLQGGEDAYFTDERICALVAEIKRRHDDCAVTLSVGERDRDSYQKMFDAGADRYLLRHETATAAHYAQLHPKELTLETRLRCLQDLKDIGYQVGCGFMVGSPYQTPELLAEDLFFIQQFRPHMVGLGPFIPHHATPFADFPAGSIDTSLFMLALVRLALPSVLLPATTALATLGKDGRLKGILAGANVVMPNLSPKDVRQQYMLYDKKASTGAEAAEGLDLLRKELATIGCVVPVERGDSPEILSKND